MKASTKMNNEHYCFGGDFEILLMSIIYKMQIVVLKNDTKGQILCTDTKKLYSIFELGDPPPRVHPPCHLYLLSYNCPMNPSYTKMFIHSMYLQLKIEKVQIHL